MSRSKRSRIQNSRNGGSTRATPSMCENLENRLMLYAAVAGWDVSQSGGAISYSYSNLLNGGMQGLTTPQLKQGVEEALSLWAAYSGLTFVELTDSGPAPSDNADYDPTGHPTIRFGYHFVGAGGALGDSYLPGNTGLAGDVHFDSAETWQIGSGSGVDFLQVAVNQIGRSLGLGVSEVTSIMAGYAAGRYDGQGDSYLYQDDISGIHAIYGSTSGRGFAQNLSAQMIVHGYGAEANDSMDFTPSGITGLVAYLGRGDDYFGLISSEPATIYGGSGNDTLVGGWGNDSIVGESGNDTIDGWLGTDILNGGAGSDLIAYRLRSDNLTATISMNDTTGNGALGENDTIQAGFETLEGGSGNDALYSQGAFTLVGDDGNDTLTGSASGEILSGGRGDDSIVGNDGDDHLFGGEGADAFRGGAGIDTVYYDQDGRTTGIFVALDALANDGTAGFDGATAGDEVGASVENIVGTDYADNITMGTSGNTIYGRAGNDTLNGADGNDVVYGEDGDDIVEGGLGTDLLDGGAGWDRVVYRSHTTAVTATIATTNTTGNGSAGENDTIVGGFNMLEGGSGNDALTSSGAFTLDGNDGNDTLTGSSSNESFWGEAGNDSITGSGGDDHLYGGDGLDVLSGGTGNDTLTGDAGNDGVFGDDGDDVVEGGLGNDTLDGGAGWDRVVYRSHTTAVTATIASTNTTGNGSTGENDTIVGGFNMLEGGSGNDTLTSQGAFTIAGNDGNDWLRGSSFNESFWGGRGDDSITAGDGDDHLYGGEGADVLSGETGIDTVHYDQDGRTAGVVVVEDQTANDGTAGFDGTTAGDNVGQSVEIIIGTNYADNITTWTAANTIYGRGGNDTLNAGSGNDSVFGEDGDDIVEGGLGTDTLDGGAGWDRVVYRTHTTAVTATIASTNTTGNGSVGENDTIIGGFNMLEGGSGNDTLTSQGAFTIAGNDGNDTLTGSASNESFWGGNGNDSINGGAGNDSLHGDAGLDTLNGGDGDDVIYARDSSQDVIDGGTGTNQAQVDSSLDTWTNIQELLA